MRLLAVRLRPRPRRRPPPLSSRRAPRRAASRSPSPTACSSTRWPAPRPTAPGLPAARLTAALPPRQVDLATAEEQAAVAAAARAINPTARAFACCRADAPLHELLAQHAFQSSEALERLPQLRRPPSPSPSSRGVEPHAAAAAPSFVPPAFLPHALRVHSVSLVAAELELDRFNAWVAAQLEQRGEHILRIKGILAVRGHERKFVFHAVHMIFEGATGSKWPADQPRTSRLVMIGRGLDRQELQQGLTACQVQLCREVAPDACS